MRPIIIGAGRGSRLKHLTDSIPKTMVPIVGRPMIESIFAALAAGGFSRHDVVFVCGYKREIIRAAYPEPTYVVNDDWPNNNILLSLLCARDHLTDGFVSTYADIVYRPEAIEKVMASPHDITLVCDTAWRKRYLGRSDHPESDAEKLRADDNGRVMELSRRLASDAATGEFIGVMRLTARGAGWFLRAFDDARARYADDDEFREGRVFRKAYLIDLLQRMIEDDVPVHCVAMDGGYMEIDTTQDAQLAPSWWDGEAR